MRNFLIIGIFNNSKKKIEHGILVQNDTSFQAHGLRKTAALWDIEFQTHSFAQVEFGLLSPPKATSQKRMHQVPQGEISWTQKDKYCLIALK